VSNFDQYSHEHRAPNATIDRLAAAYILADELIQSFENYAVAHAPLRSTDGPGTIFQLLVDVRRFEINTDSDLTAEIGLSARILNKGGRWWLQICFSNAGSSTSPIRRPPLAHSMTLSEASQQS
jgi:hypothetical protein